MTMRKLTLVAFVYWDPARVKERVRVRAKMLSTDSNLPLLEVSIGSCRVLQYPSELCPRL